MRETIGRYRIVSQLGAGGMGEVFLAEDTRLHRKVALKLISPAAATDPMRKKRMLREAQTASRLNHPNIGVVYDSGETDDGHSYIVMELIEGETLADIASRGPLAVTEAIAIAMQIAEALDEAHRQNVVHRDLKPSNVMVTPSGRVKVVDFGLATLASEEDASDNDQSTQVLTREGVVVGTLLYMSPEQATGQKVDGRSDIFSFGSVLYELLTGRRAFAGPTLVSAIHAITQGEPAPVGRPGESAVPELEHIIRKCLRKNRSSRYQSAAEIITDLRSLKDGELTVSSPRHRAGELRSLAVLPFANMSGDADTEYFSDGMTEEIMNSLANVEGLRVASRSSVFALKGKKADVRELGRTLLSDAVVEGSVRKAGNRIRVVAQLTSTSDGYQLWSQSFDRELTDVFEIQTEIATAIASKLRGEDVAAVKESPTQNLEAYRYFLAGRSLARQEATDPLRSAIRNYERAVELDPAFALAYAELASAHSQLVSRTGTTPEEGYPKAISSARQAIAIDPASSVAHATLAAIFAKQRKWLEAEQELKQTIAAAPNSTDAYKTYTALLLSLGRSAEAMEMARKIYSLDSTSTATMGRTLYHVGAFEEALPFMDRALASTPQSAVLHYYRAMTVAQIGRFAEAEREMQAAIDLAGDHRWRMHLAHILALKPAPAEARALALEVMDQSSADARPRVEAATVYAVLGEKEEALRWLEEAYFDRPSDLTDIKTEPDLAPLHGHPRFEAILDRLGLPPSTATL